MNDFLGGENTTTVAISLQTSLYKVLASAQFLLRKYNSNSSELPSRINPELTESLFEYNFCEPEFTFVLGLLWNPKEDKFQTKFRQGTALANKNSNHKNYFINQF